MMINILESELPTLETLKQWFEDALAGHVEQGHAMLAYSSLTVLLTQANNAGRLIERWEAN